MKKYLLLIFLLLFTAFLPSAKAVDPATVTAAAPKALELAAIWSLLVAGEDLDLGFRLVQLAGAKAHQTNPFFKQLQAFAQRYLTCLQLSRNLLQSFNSLFKTHLLAHYSDFLYLRFWIVSVT